MEYGWGPSRTSRSGDWRRPQNLGLQDHEARYFQPPKWDHLVTWSPGHLVTWSHALCPPALLTRSRNRLPNVCKGTVDGLLGLVAMLPQEHVADPFPELWSQKSTLYLLLNDIIWRRNKQVGPMWKRKSPGL